LPFGLGAQEMQIDSVNSKAFQQDFEAMVNELAMSDTVEVEFRRIYAEYGIVMKEAYENRTSWMALGHTYEWASRDRDTKLKAILTSEQLYLFKKRQKELEQAARERKRQEEQGQ
jgi:predicted nucleic acid-binding protein